MTEWVLVPREPTAKMVLAAFDAITNASGEGMIRARWRCMLDAAPAAPQQAEPVAQIGWADEFGNIFPMGAWKPAQRTHHDSHKTAWRAVYLHPPAEPQQAEPVAWYDPTNKIPRQAVTFSKADRDEWPHIYKEPLYLHPPAAEVQLLRDAVAKLSTIVRVPNAEHIADEHNAAVAFLRRALEGGE